MPDETVHHETSANNWRYGGAGTDVFVFGPDNGNDLITDFTNGEDVIDLSAFATIADFSDLTIVSRGPTGGHHRSQRARRRHDPAPGLRYR